MPGYLHSFEWVRTLWPLLIVAALVSLAVWIGYVMVTAGVRWRSSARKPATAASGTVPAEHNGTREPDPEGARGKALLVVFSFSMLGITIGWLTGDSGQQVLASVLPAVLTLIGGLVVFLVGKQLRDATMIASALTGLTLNLLVGALLASENTLTVKEHELEANQQAFRAQVSANTGLKSDSDIDKLQQKLTEGFASDAPRGSGVEPRSSPSSSSAGAR